MLGVLANDERPQIEDADNEGKQSATSNESSNKPMLLSAIRDRPRFLAAW